MVLTSTFLRNSFLAAGFSKVVEYFGFLLESPDFIEGKVTVNAQKYYFQEQLIRNERSKYQKILASIVGFV